MLEVGTRLTLVWRPEDGINGFWTFEEFRAAKRSPVGLDWLHAPCRHMCPYIVPALSLEPQATGVKKGPIKISPKTLKPVVLRCVH